MLFLCCFLFVFLGSACSGKTTFLKQLRILYDGGFSDMERREFKPIIFENVKRATTVILEGMRDVDLSLEGREFDVSQTVLHTYIPTLLMLPKWVFQLTNNQIVSSKRIFSPHQVRRGLFHVS